MTEQELDIKKIDIQKYEIVRDYIKHEDSLINNRLTWLLVSQGLIFTAYSACFLPMSNIASHLDTKKCIKISLWLIKCH